MKKLYKFLRTGLKSDSGNKKWVVGQWEHENTVNICNSGFHASPTPQQAFSYVQGEIIAVVDVKGKSDKQEDKECWSDMKIVKAYHWKKEDSVALAIFAAEQVIKNYEKMYPNDSRPRDAIEAAKKVLADDTVENRNAADSAAYSADSAAYSAAYSAYSAAYSAYSAAYSARSAAYSARSAAYSTAYSARAAADSAARSTAYSVKKKLVASINKFFLARIKKLEPYV